MKIFIIIFLLFIVNGCMITEIIDMPENKTIEAKEQEMKSGGEESKGSDTTETNPTDTTRIPISFDVSVEEWEDVEI